MLTLAIFLFVFFLYFSFIGKRKQRNNITTHEAELFSLCTFFFVLSCLFFVYYRYKLHLLEETKLIIRYTIQYNIIQCIVLSFFAVLFFSFSCFIHINHYFCLVLIGVIKKRKERKIYIFFFQR